MLTSYWEGLLLGISTGTACLAYCGPVLVPYLMAEKRGISGNFHFLGLFLAGRLAAYMVVAMIAGFAGSVVIADIGIKQQLVGIAYIALSAVMLTYGFVRFKEICLGKVGHRYRSVIYEKYPGLIPVAGGILTGVNICPPFLLAITQAADSGGVGASVLFFLTFFLGTTLYFVPLPFIGAINRSKSLPVIGRFAAIAAGAIYLYKGLITIIN